MRSFLAVAAICTLALLAACDGDSDADASATPTTAATPTAEATPTQTTSASPTSTTEPTPRATTTPQPTSVPGPRRTGQPTLDTVIEAVEAHDIDTLLAHLRTEEVECSAPADFSQLGSPPFCEDEGVPLGTELTVAAVGHCEGSLTTNLRGTLEFWLTYQDGLYGIEPTQHGPRLVFHGRAGGLNAGKTLTVESGQITSIGLGCHQHAEAMVPPSDLAYGPWFEPLTPRLDAEAARAVMAPFLDAIEAGDAGPLTDATEQDFIAHGCQTSRDAAASITTFLAAEPTLVGIYEPPKGSWTDEWWLVFRLVDGDHLRLVVDVRPHLSMIVQPCDATLEEVTTGLRGDAVPLP